MTGNRVRPLAVALALCALFLTAGCSSYSARTEQAESGATCDEVLASIVQRVRSDDTAGAINEEIDWLSRNCATQYDIATDYFSGRGSLTGEFAGGGCTSLVDYLRPEALALLTEEGLCGNDPVPDAPDVAVPSGGGIPWNEAVGHAGTSQRVCGPLAGDGVSDDDVFLNLGLDYPDPGRFQIVLWDIGGLEPIPYGATLCTEGVITLYNGVAQIQLEDPSRIEIYQ